MRVLIHVCAMDEENGIKATREDVIDVPGKVVKLHEMIGGGDEHAVLRRIGDSVFAAAMRELQAGRVDVNKALTAAGGGRIGGRDPAQAVAEATGEAPARPAVDLAATLGLDLIQAQVRKERAQPTAPGRPVAPPQQRAAGPGPVGFPRG
jgi:hypothetical protein